MTRILYVTDSLIAGGIESQLVELIRRLDRKRFEPHVLVFYKMPTHSPHFLPQLREAGVPVTTLDLGWSARDKLEATRQIIAQTWKLRPQIVQAENYHSNLLTRAARPLMPPSTKLIGTHRGVYTSHQLRFEKLEHRFCDAFVASATHLRRQLIEGAGVPAGRVVVIPNSIDVERFSHAAARGVALRAELAPKARRVFVSIGRVSREKRMDLIADALGQLKREGVTLDDVRLLLVGHAQEAKYQEMLDAAIAQADIADLVIQHSTTAEPEAYLAASDVSILASPSEGLPVVALESLAAGKPVILSQGANAAKVITDGRTGWVTPTNAPEHLAVALRKVIEAPASALEHMHADCQADASTYTAQALVRRYMALYDALLTAPTAQRTQAFAEATR
ncbi:MAG TPA: glycosyltransferase family 4 protein [Ktedonobacterales bacterium]